MHCCLSYETRQVLVEEPNRLNILNCDQSCQFIVINFLCVFIYLISCLARRDLSIFLAVISDTREFCAGERRLITHGGISTRLGVIPSVTPGIYSLCECIMSVIRWLVVQEVCSSFEFARHFESHLAWPPPFICACKHDDFHWTFHCYYVTQYTYYILNLFV